MRVARVERNEAHSFDFGKTIQNASIDHKLFSFIRFFVCGSCCCSFYFARARVCVFESAISENSSSLSLSGLSSRRRGCKFTFTSNMLPFNLCVCVFVVVVFPIDSDVWFGRICASSHRSGSARTDAHRAQHSHHFCVLIGLAYKMSVRV